MPREPIRIVLVDDHKMIRESWKLLLENNSELKIVAESDNGFHALDLCKEFMPDILLIDINMSPVSGFTLTENIRKELPGVKIIGISVSNQPKYASRMLSLGAKGYLTKTSSLEEIRRGIKEVYAGGTYVCEEIKKQMTEST